ncbi:WD40 repeat domain-containing serine/threonine protein kinase [Umezawaea sp. NPDC059074]|uniref:WD40 repeat domain-containing serine/threonine protein kinase n=1 Tax=Umezawaea sp. NPDC059074 TaxID=3346716 RepID=UPI003679262E
MSEGDPVGLPDFGPYHVRELLGQGGMGVVHRAYDTVNDRVVALKRLSGADREYQVRFRRESRIVAGLKHPNVVPVNDFGEIDGQLYLDMKLVEGVDLRRALGSGSLDQDAVLGILAQVADALDAAHAMGLVHRDVKPSNVLVDGSGHAYLADFGIARETSSEVTVLTASGDLIGSWDYLAPERLSGGEVDGRADQYSLACVLFECLTGRLPYPGIDTAAKVAAHLLQPAPAPSLFVPTITPALDAVVLRGLAKAPGRRFPTSSELIAAARAAAYAGVTVRSAAHTAPGPSKERDQGRLVRAIVRSTAVRKPPTLVIPHDRPPTCPYPGLSGFDQEDGDLFHGRDHVVTDLLVRLAEQLDGGEPVVLVGASGAGKSSVLHAGLLPALALGDGPGQGGWPQVVLTPGRDPIVNLATALAGHGDIVAAEWVRVLREKPAEFGSVCARALGGDGVRPVIVVDQFEELFTHGTSEADRVAFATALASASPALVVLAVRADLVDRCIDLAPLLPALTSPVLLGAMDATELRQAIVSPARDSGIEVEPGLPERLIADLGVRGEIGYDPGALPRLAHALRESWNYRDGDVLTLAAYRRAGGIDGAVSRTAEEIHGGLDDSGRRTLRTILLRLVTVSDDGGVARRRVDPEEVAESDQRGIVDALIAARLVTVDGSGARLSHEALLTAWPRLRDWIDEDRAGLVQHRRLSDSVRAWAESGRQEDDLYRGARLAALTSWLDSAADRVRLNPVEQDFLARSTEAEHAGHVAARRRTTRLRGMVTALSLLLVVAGIAGFVAYRLGQDARAERDRADAGKQQNLSRQLAAESALARGVDPRRQALAALGAWGASPTVEARSAVLAGASDGYRGRMTGHVDAVTSIALTPDGQTAVTGGRDGSLRLWDVPSKRQLAVLADGDGWYRTVSLRADGRVLAAVDLLSKKTQLWDVPKRELLATVPVPSADTALAPDGRTVAVNIGNAIVVFDTTTLVELTRFPVGVSLAVVYSPDGSLIASTADNDVEVHRAADGAPVARLTGHTDKVKAVAFNKAGTAFATVSDDATARLWDTGTWTTTDTLDTGDSALASVAFDPQGTVLVTGGVSSALSVWEPKSGALLIRYATGASTILSLAVSADGHTLLGADVNGTVRKWSYAKNVLGARQSPVLATAYQPRGTLLATADATGIVRLWDAATGDQVRQMAGHQGGTLDVAFNADGTELATTGEDGAVVVWTVATGAEARRYSSPGSVYLAVAFSPDGTRIAVGGRATTESTEDRDELVLLKADDLSVVSRRATRKEERNSQPNGIESNYPTGIAFSPDGRTLAVPLSGGKVALWNLVDTGSALTLLGGHDTGALDAEFSPDGTTLATGGVDRLVRLWRVRDGQQVGQLTGSDSPLRKVAFSPDGKTLAAASQDTVLRLWDVAAGQPLARLDRHSDDLNDVAFDPSGEHVASGGADGTTRIWDLVPDHGVRVLCGLLDRDTLVDEWRALGPDRGDPPTCPN